MHLRFNPATSALDGLATTDLEPGSQVLRSYGPHGNAELLATYGFALPTNAHERVPLQLAVGKDRRPSAC